MVKKDFIIISVIFFILLIIIGAAVYFFVFKDKNEEVIPSIETKEVLVEAIDVKTKERIEVNFTLVSNKTIVLASRTRNDSFIKINVPINYTLMEFYVNDKNYYTDLRGLIGNKISIETYPVGNMSVFQQGNLSDGNILINLSTSFENREVNFCVDWSINVIDVEAPFPVIRNLNNKLDCVEAGAQWIEEFSECSFWCKFGLKEKNVTLPHCSITLSNNLPPKRLFGKIVKCYYSRKTITTNDPLVFNLKIKSYDMLNENDFVELYFIDSNNNLRNVYVNEDEQWNDVAAQDFLFVVR